MKLIYAHIVEHKILQNISIHFSSKFKCSYDGETLRIEENSGYLADYYDGVTINAIVGKNGSGKTSILDFIETSMAYTESIGVIVWFREEDNYFAIQNVNIGFHFEVILPSGLGSNNCVIGTGLGDFGNTLRNFIKDSNLSCLKVNNVNEFKLFAEPKINNDFVVDYSMSNINRSHKKKSEFMQQLFYFLNHDVWTEERETRVAYKFTVKPISKSILSHVEEDFKDQDLTDFIRDRDRDRDRKSYEENEENEFNFFHDEEINSDFRSFKKKLLHLTNCHFNRDFLAKDLNTAITLSNIFTLISTSCSSMGTSERLKKFINTELCLYILNSKSIMPIDIETIIKTAYNKWNSYEEENIINNNVDYKENHSTHNINELISNIKLGLDSYTDISYFIYESKDYITGVSNNSFTINNASFLTLLHQKILHIDHWLNGSIVYGWEGFSSGELARIGLFSLIFDYLSNNENRFTLLFIDEADLYLHPEWQRTFVSELIKLIKTLMMENNVQIVISTHSPLIIGDFLPEDIICLKSSDDKNTTKNGIGFGTKLSDSYLEGMHLDSTYGEHSRVKLQDLIDKKMNNHKMTNNDLKLATKISNSSLREALLND